MANIVLETGDHTTHDVKPDFDSGKGYYWMKQVKEAMKTGTVDNLPHRPPASSLAQRSWNDQVHRRLNRQTFGGLGIRFDANGRIIREG